MQNLLEIGLTNAVAATALGLFVWLITRVLRRPAVVHGLWLLVLLKLVTPPLVRIPLGDYSADRSWVTPSALSEKAEPALVREGPEAPALRKEELPLEVRRSGSHRPRWATNDRPVGIGSTSTSLTLPPLRAVTKQTPSTRSRAARWHLRRFVVAAWGLGSCLVLLLITLRLVRFRRLLRLCRPAPAGLEREVAELSRQLGLRRPPKVVLVPGLVSPFVWTHRWREKLYFPELLLARLERPGRTTLIAHEIAHLRRRDHWVRWFELPVTVLYWWHPVVWWARRQIRVAEEQCCDAWVVWTLPDRRRDYARALMQTVDFLSESRTPVPASVTGAGQVHLMKRRLAMILRGKTKRSMSIAGWLAVALLAALVLPTLPSWGQSDENEADQAKPKQAATEESIPKPSKKADMLPSFDYGGPAPGSVIPTRPDVEYLPQPSEKEKKIETALDEPTTLEFEEETLENIFQYLQDVHGIPIFLDRRDLEDYGIFPSEETVSINLTGISLRSGLRLLLEQLELDYLVQNNVLVITSAEKANKTLITRVYVVRDLWAEPKDSEELVDAITDTVSPDRWNPEGLGTIVPITKSRSLVVRQTYRVHEELLRFFRALRAASDLEGVAKHGEDRQPAKKRDVEPMALRADGQVVYVSTRLGLVWINLGKDDDMKAGRKYVIYSKSNRMERKAEIEVTGVRGPHLSQARVTEFVAGDAMGILEGDLILADE